MTREEFQNRYEKENLLKIAHVNINHGLQPLRDYAGGFVPCYGCTQTTKDGKWYVYYALVNDIFDRATEPYYIGICKEFNADEEEKAFDYLYELLSPKKELELTEEEKFYSSYKENFPEEYKKLKEKYNLS